MNISGGTIGDFHYGNIGSFLNIFGGLIGENFRADWFSTTNLTGTQFILDGIDITPFLTANVPLTITDRNVTLSGLFADGSPFSFDLNSTDKFSRLFPPQRHAHSHADSGAGELGAVGFRGGCWFGVDWTGAAEVSREIRL